MCQHRRRCEYQEQRRRPRLVCSCIPRSDTGPCCRRRPACWPTAGVACKASMAAATVDTINSQSHKPLLCHDPACGTFIPNDPLLLAFLLAIPTCPVTSVYGDATSMDHTRAETFWHKFWRAHSRGHSGAQGSRAEFGVLGGFETRPAGVGKNDDRMYLVRHYDERI
jgi:hypothetical protein